MPKLQKLIHYLIYLLVFLLPWQTRLIYKQIVLNNFNWEYATLSLYVTELLLGIILFLSVIYFIPLLKSLKLKKTIKEQNKKNVLVWLLLILCLIVNCFVALNQEIAFYKFSQLIIAVAFALVLVSTRIDWTKATWAFVFSGTIQASLAISQFIEQKVQANKWLGLAEQNPETLGTPVVQLENLRWLRTFGALPHPNILAGFLAVSLILIIGLFALTKIKKHQKFLSMIFVITFLGLLTTLSRSAVIVFILAIIIFSFVARKDKILTKHISKFALIALFIIIIFTVSFPNLISARTSINNELEAQSNITRLEQYKQFLPIMKTHWLTGLGLGNYTVALVNENQTLEGWQYQPIHNTYLLIFGELGIIGLAINLMFLIYCLFNLFKNNNWSIEKTTSFIALLTIAGLALFDHYLWSFWFGLIMFSFIIGLNILTNKTSKI